LGKRTPVQGLKMALVLSLKNKYPVLSAV